MSRKYDHKTTVDWASDEDEKPTTLGDETSDGTFVDYR